MGRQKIVVIDGIINGLSDLIRANFVIIDKIKSVSDIHYWLFAGEFQNTSALLQYWYERRYQNRQTASSDQPYVGFYS